MKQVFAFIVSLLVSITASANTTCPKLSTNQINVLHHAHQVGLEFNLEHTLPALALTESSAGEYLVNGHSNDFGVYQANKKTICNQAGFKLDSSECDGEVFEVSFNISKSDEHAIKTLLYWRNYHKAKSFTWYEDMIRSYNEGFNYKNKKSEHYWKLYKRNLSIVKQCTSMFV